MWFYEFFLHIGLAFIAWVCVIGSICMPMFILVLGLIEGLAKLPAGTKRTWNKTLYAVMVFIISLKGLIAALALNTLFTVGLALS